MKKATLSYHHTYIKGSNTWRLKTTLVIVSTLLLFFTSVQAKVSGKLPVSVNTPPTVQDIETTIQPGQSVDITLQGEDADGDELTYFVVDEPESGSLSAVTGNVVTYTSENNFEGTATFSYQVSDMTDSSNVATVSITKKAVDTPPTFTLSASEVEAGEDFTETKTVTVTPDTDTPPATYSLTPAGVDFANVSINGQNGTITIKAIKNTFERQEFTVTADAGEGNTATQSFTLTVYAINDAPVITTQAKPLAVNQGESLPIPFEALTVTDPDNTYPDDFTLTVSAGSNYTVSGTNITPNAHFTGDLPVNVSVSDGEASSNTFVLTVSVASTNTAPVAKDVTVTTEEGQPVKITLDASDAENDALTYSIVNNPDNGTLTAALGNVITYTPDENQSSSDSFTYKASDGKTGSNEAKVSIMISQAAVLAPTFALNPNSVTLQEDFTETATVTVTPDDNTLNATYSLTPASVTFANVSINATDGKVTITAKANASGSRTFTITANAGGGNTATKTFDLTVTAINDIPSFTLSGDPPTVAQDAGAQTVANFAADISDGGDAGQTLTFAVGKISGSLTFTQEPAINATNGTLTYQPAPGSFGTAVFSVVLKDDGTDNNQSAAQNFTITVSEAVVVPPAFTLSANSVALQEDFTGTNTITISPDADTPPATYSLTPASVDFANVSLNASTKTISISAVANGFGTQEFTVTADAGDGNTATKTFNLTVTAINDIPSFTLSGDPPTVAQDAGAQTVANFAADISDGGDAGQTLTFAVGKISGSLTFTQEPAINATNGTLTYQPAPGSFGTAVFSVVLKDDGTDNNQSAAQNFTITVSEAVVVPPAFTLSANSVALQEDFTGTNTITISPDADTPPATYSLAPASVDFANVSLNASTKTISISAVANGFGTQEFTVTADVGDGNTAIQTFTLIINSVNDLPVLSKIETEPVFFNRGDAAQIVTNTLEISDLDNEQLQSATISFTKEGSAIYKQDEDMLTYTNTIGVQAAFDAASGVLTFTGAASLADYQTLLRSLQYSNTVDNPTQGLRQLAFAVKDDENESNTLTRYIAVSSPNLPPVVSSFTREIDEDQSYTFSANDFSDNYQDQNQDPFTGTYIRSIPAHGILILDGVVIKNEDILNAPSVLGRFAGLAVSSNNISKLVYTPEQMYAGNDSFKWTASDSNSLAANEALVSFIISNINSAPVISAPSNVTVAENTPFAFTNISVSDTDVGTGDLQVTLSVTEGTLSISNSSILTALSFSAGDGTDDASMVFQASQENINGALGSLTYSTGSSNATTDNLNIKVSDLGNTGAGGAKTVETNVPIIINSTNDLPVLSGIESDTLVYAQGSGAVPVTATIEVSDTDSDSLIAATITITDNYLAAEDLLSFSGTDQISVETSGNSLTLSGKASPADYQQALRSVTYENSSATPNPLPRTATFQVTDANNGISQSASRYVLPVIVDDAARLVLANIEDTPVDYFVDGASINITNSVSIQKTSTSIQRAVVRFLDNTYIPAEDSLSLMINLPEGSSLSWNSNTGSLTLEGNLPAESYTTLLRSVEYVHKATGTVTLDNRKIGIQIFGNLLVSNEVSRTLRILKISAEAGEDMEICAGEETTLEASATGGSGSYQYLWTCNQDDCRLDNSQSQTTTARPDITTTYIVTVTDTKGNVTTTDTLTIQAVSCGNQPLSIPTGITPNGDERHDTWIISNIETYARFSIEVYDRYGKRVFYAENQYQPWDATYQGKNLPVGTYYYVINLADGAETQKGSLTVLR